MVIADKGYDANALRTMIAEKGAVAVIPTKANRKVPMPFDEVAYRQRNVIERMFCRLKDWRRINTRYDRLGRNFASTIAIAAIITWWS
jgi:transposase